MRDRRHDLLALAILVLGVSLFHLRGLRPGYTFLPVDLTNNSLPWRAGAPRPQEALQNWLISDPLYEFYPFLANDVKTIQQTAGWPVWNPRILLGHPVLADPINQPFYPFFVLLGLIFGVARGLAIGSWLHAILAATLTFGFLRTIGCRRPAAILGAFTYALSGYMVTWFEATHRVSTLAWLPGVLWAFELAVRRRSLRYAGLAALMTALAILGGQFQFVLTFSLFLGLYAVGRTIELFRIGQNTYAWPLVVLVMTGSIGALLSAVQTVPFTELLELSHRALAQGQLHPLPLRQLVTLIVPDFYGNPASIGTHWGELNFIEGTVYAGLPALLLAGLIPFSSRRFFALFLLFATVACVYFVVGGPGTQVLSSVPFLKYASLHRSAFLLPLLIATLAATALSQPQTPIRAAGVLALLLASAIVLAMYFNWGQAREHWPQLRTPVLRAAGLLAATVVLLVWRSRLPTPHRLADWGLVALVFVDLFLFGSRFNPADPIRELMPPTPAIEYLREHAGLHRAVAYQLDEQVLIGPNVLSIYDIAQAGGYSSLVPMRLQRLVQAGDPKAEAPAVGRWLKLNPNIVFFSHPSRRLLDLLQVSHVVSPAPLDNPGVRAEFVRDGCQNDSGEITATHTVSGTFVVRDTAINRLDLQFRVRQPAEAQGTLDVRLWRRADRRQLVLDEHLEAAKLADREMVTLYFAPERQAPGQTYAWEVAAAGDPSNTGVSLCADESGQPAISVYGADWTEAYAGEVYIHERLAPLPRAYVVYATEHIPDDTRAVDRLLDETFDLRNTAVTAEPFNLPTRNDLPATRAEILDYAATRVVISATAAQRGLLILGDQFYPGWRATVDGEPATVYRVNHVMRGVVLPAGHHRVEFRFQPQSLRIGGALSLIGIAAAIALIAVDPKRRPSP